MATYIFIQLVFVDGAKDPALRLLDLFNLRPMAAQTALLLFDEICTLGCANDTAPCSDSC